MLLQDDDEDGDRSHELPASADGNFSAIAVKCHSSAVFAMRVSINGTTGRVSHKIAGARLVNGCMNDVD